MFNERLFMSQLALKDKRLNDIAEALKIDRATLYRKLKDDGRFTRSEINTIVDYLELDANTMTDIFFAE